MTAEVSQSLRWEARSARLVARMNTQHVPHHGFAHEPAVARGLGVGSNGADEKEEKRGGKGGPLRPPKSRDIRECQH